MMTSLVYAVGRNEFDEFVTALTSYTSPSEQLIKSNINDKSQFIQQIICGNDFSIYFDSNQNVWSAGCNSNGQCCTDDTQMMVHCHHIKYFQNNNIIIKKIFTTISSSTLFWLTETDQVYGNGFNDHYQLEIGDHTNREFPAFIPGLDKQNVVDVKAAHTFSIVLCRNSTDNAVIIVQFWSRTCSCSETESANLDIPSELINEITKYYKINMVLRAGGLNLFSKEFKE